MRKNVASQHVAGQMNSRTDGSPLTTAASIFVTIDGGTQTAGGGTLAHAGNGHWDYIPTQAETNGNHLAFTFVHATGVNQTVNVYTVSFDPHNTTTLGLTNLDAAITSRMATYTQPTGFLAATFPTTVASTTNITAGTITTVTNLTNAPTSGDLTATMKTSVTTAATAATPTAAAVTGSVGSVVGLTASNLDATISSRMASYTQPTGFLAATFPGTVASTTNITAGTITTATNLTNLPAITSNWLTAAGIAAGALNGKGDWNIGKTGYTLVSGPLDAAGTRTALGMASANLDTQLGTLLTSAAYTAPDNVSITAIKGKTDSLAFTVANKLDVNLLVVNGITIGGAGTAGSPWGPA